MKPVSSQSFTAGQGLVAVGLIAICCGAPVLLAALAATGAGVWLLDHGATALAAVAVFVAIALVLVWLRLGCALGTTSHAESCCAAPPSGRQEKS